MGATKEGIVALRISRRSIGRNRLQSILIALIIALPLALASYALTYFESTKATSAEYLTNELGESQARYQVLSAPNTRAYQNPTDSWLSMAEYIDVDNSPDHFVKITDEVKNVDLIAVATGSSEFKTSTGFGSVSVVEGEVWNDHLMGHGPSKLVQGRTPQTQSEVMVSPTALERFGVKLGESISTQDGQTFTVVGVLREAVRNDYDDVVYLSTDALEGFNNAGDTKYYQISGTAPDWQQVQDLNKRGIVVLSREVLLNPPAASELHTDYGVGIQKLVTVVLLAPLVLLPVIVLAGSAFAFGTRRQTRTLAVLSSLGARRKLLIKVTIASGVWLGLIGGTLGVALGVIAEALTGAQLAQAWQARQGWLTYPGLHLPWGELALAIGLSVLLGVITSLIPAINASKVNVLATLRGTRTQTAVRARQGIGALLLLIIGGLSIFAEFSLLVASADRTIDQQARLAMQFSGIILGLAGAVLMLIGFMVGTGWILIGLRKIFSKFGITANFAGSDLHYNRKRYSPVVASVLTVTFLASFVASFFYGPTKFNADQYNFYYQPGQAAVEYMVKPLNYDMSQSGIKAASVKDFWAGVPKIEKLNADRSTILATKAFDSATVIFTTLDVINQPGVSDGSSIIPEQFDLPLPVVTYDPNKVCYYTGLTKKGTEWIQQHASDPGLNMDTPKGCVGLDDPKRTIVVGDVKALRAIAKRIDATAESTLANGGVVVFNKAYQAGTTSTISWIKPSDYSWSGHFLDKATKSVKLESALVDGITSANFAYAAMISPETARKYGITAYPTSILVNYSKDVPAAVTDRLNSQYIILNYSNGTGMVNPETFAWIIILLAAAFSLSASGIALGLSQIEARTDKRTLSAIGAPRSFRARLVALQAFALTTVGSLFGATTGIGLGAGFLNGMDSKLAVLPWPQLATLVFGIPIVAALAFWLFTPRRLKYEVRQALD